MSAEPWGEAASEIAAWVLRLCYAAAQAADCICERSKADEKFAFELRCITQFRRRKP